MQFDDQNVDVSGVQDRRGIGGPVAIGGGGLGIVGLLVYLLISVVGGGGLDPGQLVAPGGQVEGAGGSSVALAERCNTEGAIQRYDDCYLVKVYNEVNEVWTDELARRGSDYRQPGLAFFSQAVQTGCGTASSQVGPFYCPPDERIYIDIGFLEALQREFGAGGRYAQAYVMAHEAGHHLQTLAGTEREVRALQQARPDQQNELSVRMELQADCYAGVWSRLAHDRGNLSIGRAELDQAIAAAEAVGDDRIQQRTQGRVDPESWTHGSAEQRRSWFERGRSSGDLGVCDTFRG